MEGQVEDIDKQIEIMKTVAVIKDHMANINRQKVLTQLDVTYVKK